MDGLLKIFINWFPMLLVIGVWIFFMRRYQPQQNKQQLYMEKLTEISQKQADIAQNQIEVLERIATALEKR